MVVGPQALITSASSATAATIIDLFFIVLNSLSEMILLMLDGRWDSQKVPGKYILTTETRSHGESFFASLRPLRQAQGIWHFVAGYSIEFSPFCLYNPCTFVLSCERMPCPSIISKSTKKSRKLEKAFVSAGGRWKSAAPK